MKLSFFFFFSSRRRHTRLQGDWSSDVCYSDLPPPRIPSRACRRSAAPAGGTSRSRWSAPRRPTSRSEERRVGEEGRSRWSADHLKKKKRKGAQGRRRRKQLIWTSHSTTSPSSR